jgi:hypothetical protein
VIFHRGRKLKNFELYLSKKEIKRVPAEYMEVTGCKLGDLIFEISDRDGNVDSQICGSVFTEEQDKRMTDEQKSKSLKRLLREVKK